MEYHYEVNGTRYTVRVDQEEGGHYRVTVGERTYVVQAERREPGVFDLSVGTRYLRAYVVQTGTRRLVALDANTYVLERLREGRRQRHLGAPHAGQLEAQMPGQVIAVLVEEGQEVDVGQPLVILEAMKMELRIVAPRAGRVRALRCQPGDVVDRGQQLVELE
ncbi:MAG: biotin/lipoyl-containing protein [Ardenticatenia bacterium]|nr:biotin/lipoyl-containing protein [Ardenticatenia bacterium]